MAGDSKSIIVFRKIIKGKIVFQIDTHHPARTFLASQGVYTGESGLVAFEKAVKRKDIEVNKGILYTTPDLTENNLRDYILNYVKKSQRRDDKDIYWMFYFDD